MTSTRYIQEERIAGGHTATLERWRDRHTYGQRLGNHGTHGTARGTTLHFHRHRQAKTKRNRTRHTSNRQNMDSKTPLLSRISKVHACTLDELARKQTLKPSRIYAAGKTKQDKPDLYQRPQHAAVPPSMPHHRGTTAAPSA
jgi:hypothetical protein